MPVPLQTNYDSEMPDEPTRENDLGFRFAERSGGRVEITRQGATVTTLIGHNAARFMRRVASSDFPTGQRLMAKATGQYKFGNERAAKKHPRNR